ncbi:MAG: sigma 54-interacting transcriptional regulator [Magnetococcales bacterium]|nr:sigma 54-interacting transcriptional regulator [Magnetococcales bacterium]
MAVNVLLVSNDQSFCEMVIQVMSRAGYITDTVGSLKAAIEAFQKHQYDLVVSELSVSGGSGFQLIDFVNQFYPTAKIVLVADTLDAESVQSALRAGAFDYLVKPVLALRLAHVANLAMEHQWVRNERKLLINRMEAVFQGVDDAIVALDHEWRIIQINDAAIRLLGLDVSSMNRLLQDEMAWLFLKVDPLLRQAREEGGGKRAVCLIVMHENDTERILNCTASLFHDPLQNDQGVILVVRDESRLAMLERETQTRQGWHGLVGSSLPMQEVYDLIERLAEVDSSVLITGETGTGKELVARALHTSSTRSHCAFVAVNCAALPVGLMESELFGHVRGAFTNAVRDKPGRFKLADGGTIFLDEIGDLSLEMQVRLLRVLQEQVFEAVGDNCPIRVNVRVVAATHRNLRERVQEGNFREDLYYRLKVVEIRLPSLREHKGDLPMLIEHFLKKFNVRMKRSVKGVTEEVLVAIMEHDWPGNVRELEHTLEHAMVVAPQSILAWSNLPPDFRTRYFPVLKQLQLPVVNCGRPRKLGQLVDGVLDRSTILRVLEDAHWQLQTAATRLGISRSTLWRRMKSMSLRNPAKAEAVKAVL